VTSPLATTERYDLSRHDTSAFESGSEALDRWLVRYAGRASGVTRREVAPLVVEIRGDGGPGWMVTQ
jgi:hypothetical protein